MFAMPAQQLAYSLVRIQHATSPPQLCDIAEDVQREHTIDKANPRIVAMVAETVGRLATQN